MALYPFIAHAVYSTYFSVLTGTSLLLRSMSFERVHIAVVCEEDFPLGESRRREHFWERVAQRRVGQLFPGGTGIPHLANPHAQLRRLGG